MSIETMAMLFMPVGSLIVGLVVYVGATWSARRDLEKHAAGPRPSTKD